MDYVDIDAPLGASGTIASENDFSDMISSESSVLHSNYTTTIRPSHSSHKEYQFDGSSVVVILYFIIVQASIWAFFIFCYFARKGRSSTVRRPTPSNSPPPSASADMPPDYASSVNPADYPPFIEIVLDEKPPDYDKVIAAAATPSGASAKR